MKHLFYVITLAIGIGTIDRQECFAQDLKFADLYDQSIIDRQHLAEAVQVKYAIVFSEQGRIRVRTGLTERGFADSLTTVEEVGIIVKGKDRKKEVSHGHRTVINVQEWEDSDFDRNEESSSAFHVLRDQDRAWLGIGSSKFSAHELDARKAPKCLADFPFEVLPFCDLYPFISHGGGLSDTIDRFSSSDVVHDRRTKEGKREILLLYADRAGAARVIIPNFINWQAETVQCFVCDAEPRGRLDDPELEDKVLNTWRNSATVEVTWGVAELDGEKIAVPSRFAINAISPGRERVYTVDGEFADWKFGNQLDEKALSLDHFKEVGMEGIDFVEIKQAVVKNREVKDE